MSLILLRKTQDEEVGDATKLGDSTWAQLKEEVMKNGDYKDDPLHCYANLTEKEAELFNRLYSWQKA